MSQATNHMMYMQRCLDLAAESSGFTAPNPMVGCVVVHNHRIIGEGYHRQFGGPHAEVEAIRSVGDRSLLRQSVLYVNLEPCSHTGKTPPCTGLIIESGIPEVVIGTIDPNPLVSGNGIRQLQAAGVITLTGVLAESCQWLNRRFFTFHQKKRPYVILKWAQTADGFIDRIRGIQNPAEPYWISNEVSKMLVHKWRAMEQAILVGTRTALLDNPRLNVREWHGRSPLRMVIDRKLRLPHHLNLFDGSLETWVFNEKVDKTDGNIRYARLDFSNLVQEILRYLHYHDIQSVFIEGGRQLIESFLTEGLWDEARVITGMKRFGEGLAAPAMPQGRCRSQRILDDILTVITREP